MVQGHCGAATVGGRMLLALVACKGRLDGEHKVYEAHLMLSPRRTGGQDAGYRRYRIGYSRTDLGRNH